MCQVHLKNEKKLLAEPGLVDWTAAVRALRAVQYGVVVCIRNCSHERGAVRGSNRAQY